MVPLAPPRDRPSRPVAVPLTVLLALCFGPFAFQHAAENPSASPCPVFGEGLAMGLAADPALNEASGLAASQSQWDLLWAHNDSGDFARLYALSLDGTSRGTWTLPIGIPYDCEALAIGPAPDALGDHIFLADIGNNGLGRTSLQIYRIREPDVDDSRLEARPLTDVVTFEIIFPPGIAEDLEAFAVDPTTGDFVFFGKSYDRRSRVLMAPAPSAGDTVDLVNWGTLPIAQVTGADISRDGSMLLLRTYEEAFIYLRRNGESWVEALLRPACATPIGWEAQGEAVAFLADGSGYVTISEGRGSPLLFYPRIPWPTEKAD